MRTSTNTILATAAFATAALARTDLVGCTTTDVSSPAGASVAWYVPGTGELCDPLDCGGGRAPPKTTVPGCPQYSGTETYSPSYLAGYQAAATPAPSTTAASSAAAESDGTSSDNDDDATSSSSVDWSALETDTAESTWDMYTTLASVTGPIPASSTPSESEAASSAAQITESASAAPSAPSSEGSTLVAQTTAAGSASNGTTTGGYSGNNGTLSNTTGGASPSVSAPASEGGAAGTAKAWAGLVLGLAALVAAL